VQIAESSMRIEMKIDFEKMQGLVPAIIQDAGSGDILMLGFMNQEAWDKTASEGYVTFYSRTRNQLWTKGETSGNRLKVVSASTDCDFDSLLIKVEVEGKGVVCHEGTRSCFTKELAVISRGPHTSEKPPRNEGNELKPAPGSASVVQEAR
jgi:phosphoribosyl-ATP pyrophosphohydrolase/phosphoribosyl-AMP cyclohydrolase